MSPRPVAGAEAGLGSRDAGRAGAALVRAERRQVARALHRSPVQLLAAACLRLQAASLDGRPDPAAVDAATRELEEAMLALRGMMDRLASSEIEREVLLDALVGVEADPAEEPGPGAVTVEQAAELVARAAARRS